MTYVLIEPAATRLGNWMFQYAAAKREDEEVAFVVPDDQYQWVRSIEQCADLFGRMQIMKLSEVPACAEIRRGLFQDAKFVDRAQCRGLFACPDAVRLALMKKYGELLKYDKLVSIHVRRGDYLRLPHRHPFVGGKYLREAVQHFPGAEFLVFSDDMVWCKRFFKGPRFHFAEGNSALVDLYLMSLCCGGHICSNSTFSWWGAFLGEGRTVLPSMWYGIALKNEDWEGLYFEGSEVLRNRYSIALFFCAIAYVIKECLGRVVRVMRTR